MALAKGELSSMAARRPAGCNNPPLFNSCYSTSATNIMTHPGRRKSAGGATQGRMGHSPMIPDPGSYHA